MSRHSERHKHIGHSLIHIYLYRRDVNVCVRSYSHQVFLPILERSRCSFIASFSQHLLLLLLYTQKSRALGAQESGHDLLTYMISPTLKFRHTHYSGHSLRNQYAAQINRAQVTRITLIKDSVTLTPNWRRQSP